MTEPRNDEARQHLVQASIYLANDRFIDVHNEIEAALAVLAATGDSEGPLDVAWEEAEAERPQGWGIGVHRFSRRGGGSVYRVGAADDGTWKVEAKGDTLPAALRALAARLSSKKAGKGFNPITATVREIAEFHGLPYDKTDHAAREGVPEGDLG